MTNPLVLGIDSSTQSTKALLVDAASGDVVDQASAAHPGGTEVDPRTWIDALDKAAGPLLARADAVSVGGQQHGMVALDSDRNVVRDALLWNDTRSAPQARALIEELGGPQACADATGSVLVASFTITKLRWMAENEPANAARTDAVLLPHDYVSWSLAADKTVLATDRGDASGTGYFSPSQNAFVPELAERGLGHSFTLPRIAAPHEFIGETKDGVKIAAGTGDNAAAALGLDLQPGAVFVSLGTSGVVSTVATAPTADASGMISGFADATGRYLPLACTLNCSRILEVAARLLAVDYDELARLALAAPPGANGYTFLPYLDGERTPNRPNARGTMHGLTSSTTREDLARAAFEALLCSVADGVAALEQATGTETTSVSMIGGVTKSPAIHKLAPEILGLPVTMSQPLEYVARGAARQAAWALSGSNNPPEWNLGETTTTEGEFRPEILAAYRDLRDRTEGWA